MRNVLVTGGSRGIGLAIVQRLAATGYGVIAVARRRERRACRRDEDAADAGQGEIHFHACDLSEIDEIADFVKSAREKFGPLYGLVNNAGISVEGLLANMHNSQIEQLVRVNVVSPIVLTKFVVRHMMADGGGRIVNIASIIGSTGYNGLSVYGATKAAVNGFTRSLAREVGRAGHHRQRGRARLHRDRADQEPRRRAERRIASRSALRRLAEVGRRREHGGVLDGRWRQEHHRRGDDGGCGQYGVAR